MLSASFTAAIPLARCVTASVARVGADSLHSQMQISCCVALLQCTVGLSAGYMTETINLDGEEIAMGAHLLRTVQQLLGSSVSCPIEVTTLLYCTASRISPDVPVSMALAMGEMSAAVVSPTDSSVLSMAGWSDAQRSYLAQSSAAICAITRQHAGESATTRGALLQALEGLDAMVPILVSAACKGVSEVVSSVETASSMSSLKSLSQVLLQLVHLTIGLLQIFGNLDF